VNPATPTLANAQRQIRQFTGRAVTPFRSESALLDARTRAQRFNAVALDLFALFGLLLAATGLYSTVAYSISRRSNEIAVRIALGAQRQGIMRMLAGTGMRLAANGVLVGLLGAFLTTRALRPIRMQAPHISPWVYIASALLMLGASLAASLIPASRAVQIDPVATLRGEPPQP
jgi:putative ABC transport system permease protein